jgi:hypothetical protein
MAYPLCLFFFMCTQGTLQVILDKQSVIGSLTETKGTFRPGHKRSSMARPRLGVCAVRFRVLRTNRLGL